MPREIEPVARALINSKGVQYGEFILASGTPSPFYVDLGNLRSSPDDYDTVIKAYAKMINELPFRPDLLVDVPNRATPIVAGIREIGLTLPGRINRNLATFMERNGHKSISELVGSMTR